MAKNKKRAHPQSQPSPKSAAEPPSRPEPPPAATPADMPRKRRRRFGHN